MIKIPLFLRDAFWMLVAVFLADRSFHLVINDFHTSFLDVFFKYFTHLGDGLVFLPLILYFLFLHRPTAFVLMIAGVLTLFLTAVLKQVIFEGVSRPVQYFGVEKLHLIKGVSMAHWNSFPSGHTTTVFAIFSVVVQKIKSFFWKGGLFFGAVLAGFSRVYLSQHFLLDVFVGAFLGFGIGQLSIVLCPYIQGIFIKK